jgi:hypothetical protein
LAKPKEFAASGDAEALGRFGATFIEDLDVWPGSFSVCRCVSPKKLYGHGGLMREDPPFVLTDGEKISMAFGIRAFTFRWQIIEPTPS